MEYPEYQLPVEKSEKEAIQQNIEKFVVERCRLTQEEISEFIAKQLVPVFKDISKTDISDKGDHFIEKENFQPKLQKFELLFKNQRDIRNILSENNQFSPHYFHQKLKKLGKHQLGYDVIESTSRRASSFNFVNRIDYTTYMKRLLLESGHGHDTYNRKAIITKLYLDMSIKQSNETASFPSIKSELQLKQLQSKRAQLEKELDSINAMLETIQLNHQ